MSRGRAELEATSTEVGREPLAGVSRRCVAWLLDVAAVTVLILGGLSLLAELLSPTVRFRLEAAELRSVVTVDTGRLVVDALVATALSAAYFVLPWARLGASPGQLVLRLRVRREQGGETLPFGRALVRWLLLFPPFATVSALTADLPPFGWFVWGSAPVWYFVLFLTTVRSETRQGLHDRLAGSVVDKRRIG